MDIAIIDTVHIQNFKSIRELELQLGTINILIGTNKAGKTNFIQFFELLQVLRYEELERYITQRGWADAFLHHSRKHSAYLQSSVSFKRIPPPTCNQYKVILLPNQEDKLLIR